jgi:putative FmdB family regulatory protein
MPLYEYECTACHRHTEKIQKFSDPEITTCPHCGGALKRVISAPAFSLKGGGWYADGYGSAKPAAAASEGGKGDGTAAPAAKDGGSSTPAATPAAPAPAPAAAPASSASSSSEKK